jgi:hypothetical protein
MIAFPCLYKGIRIYVQEGAESSEGMIARSGLEAIAF